LSSGKKEGKDLKLREIKNCVGKIPKRPVLPTRLLKKKTRLATAPVIDGGKKKKIGERKSRWR